MFNLSLTHVSSLYHRPSSPDVAQTEESVGQGLLDMEEQKKQRESELESVEEQLRQYTAKSQITDSELQYLLHVCVCCEKSPKSVNVLYVINESRLALFTLSFVSILNSPFRFLQRELESLKNTEHELQTLQNEVDEDTTEVIPSAV